jgi:hypothetical protein
MSIRYVRFFRDVGSGGGPLVGGKNAALGEMYRRHVKAHRRVLFDYARANGCAS